MGFDIIPGDDARMAQIFPEATAKFHELHEPCWCKPTYEFQLNDHGTLYGIRRHN